MEAKDTVMNNSGIVRATWVNPNYPKDSPVMRAEKPSEVVIYKAQAEISFKVWRDSILSELKVGEISIEGLFQSVRVEGHKAGIKEVVEWVKENDYSDLTI